MPHAVGDLKVCSACRDEKPVGEFRKNRAHHDGYANQCKLCHNASNEKFLAKQPPDYMERIRREYTLRTRYGITGVEYERMLKAAGGCCEVCGRDPGPGVNLDVDHDHQTGKVRGLLCWRCNRAMGMSGDSSHVLRALADYLDKHFTRSELWELQESSQVPQ